MDTEVFAKGHGQKGTRFSLRKLLKIRTRQQLAFWMFFVGLACIVFAVRVGLDLEFHPMVIIYMWLVAVLILSRYVFFALYNPPLLKLGEYEPTVAVIVPAKNESDAIYDTAKALHTVDYPKNKLKIILVNDGSDDDTGTWMDK